MTKRAIAVYIFFLVCFGRAAFSGELEVREQSYPNIVPPNFTVGSFGAGPSQFNDPYGIAFDRRNNLLVADCGNHRISVMSSQGEFISSFGQFGHKVGEFNCPHALAIANGTIFVLDRGNNRVQLFNEQYKAIGEWGGFGHARGSFSDPGGIAANAEYIAVADTGNNRVQVFDHSGNWMATVGGLDVAAFSQPSAVAITKSNLLFVADTHNNRIVKFFLYRENSLVSIKKAVDWGTYGSYVGMFAEPIGVAASADKLYVADLVNHRVQVFDYFGNVDHTFGRHPVLHHEGNGRLHYPVSIAVSADAELVAVCESFENRCQVFETRLVEKSYTALNDKAWWDKYPLFHYGRRLKIRFKEELPAGAIDDIITMSEPDTHQVVVFAANGGNPIRITSFGTFGSKLGELKGPHGVGVNRFGEVFVTDSFNHRIQVFDLQRSISSGFALTTAGPFRLRASGPQPVGSGQAATVSGPLPRSSTGQATVPPSGSVAGTAVGQRPTGSAPVAGSATPGAGPQLPSANVVSELRSTSVALGSGQLAGEKIVAPKEIQDARTALRPPVIRSWGGLGIAPGTFNTPSGGSSTPRTRGDAREDCADPDSADWVYLSDTRNHRIQVYHRTGVPILQDRSGVQTPLIIGGRQGRERGELNLPTDLLMLSEGCRLAVVEAFNQRVSVFNGKTGNIEFVFGQQGTEPGQFMAPSAIAEDSDGKLYVTDQGTHRVSVWAPDRDGKVIKGYKFEKWWGRYGVGDGEFLYPQGIAIDGKGYAYVVDFGNHRGQVYTIDGAFVRNFGLESLQPVFQPPPVQVGGPRGSTR